VVGIRNYMVFISREVAPAQDFALCVQYNGFRLGRIQMQNQSVDWKARIQRLIETSY